MNTLIRTVVVGVALLGTSLLASAQVEAFKRAAKLPDVEYVYLSKSILSMVGGSLPVQGMDEVASQLNSMEVLSVSSQESVQKTYELLESTRNAMELLTHMVEADVITEIYGIEDDGRYSELLVLVMEDSQLSAVMMKGNINPDVIKSIAVEQPEDPQPKE